MTATDEGVALALMEIERIKQLKARYFRLVDAKDWPAWRDCFTDDMQSMRDGVAVSDSGDAFVSRVASILAGSVTVHHGHMPEIELTGPTAATGIWALVDWVDFPGKPVESWIGYGHYHEEYEKGADGRWRIKQMEIKRIKMVYPNRTEDIRASV
jgi:hypothetical protein